MSLSAVATAASGILGGAAAEKFDPSFALAFRFHLEIDGIKTGWQSCTGLKVDFKPVEVKAGGGYTSARFLPGEISHPRVILRRAINKKDANELQKWLASKAHSWVTTDDQPNFSGSTATITLHDSYGELVMTWTLRNARPAAWSGPDLDASASKLAIETLELVHEGFEVQVQGGAQPEKPTEPKPLKLTEAGNTVQFLYPPTEIGLQHSTQQTTIARPTALSVMGANADDGEGNSTAHGQEWSSNPADTTTITLNNLLLAGKNTAKSVLQLKKWATRKPSQNANTNDDVLPVLKLSWGTGFPDLEVTLKSLTASFTRFTSDGCPIQAKVGITLLTKNTGDKDQLEKLSNPTSGGIPGRSTHLLSATDSLSSLANTTYGKPEHWRTIAAANGMDDPLRLRPGTVCYLPAPAEMDSVS